MAGFFQTVLNGATQTLKDQVRGTVRGFFGANEPFVRDFTHASKTFRVNSYQYAPKLKFLFHVYFEIAQQANVFDQNDHLSLTVKTVKLPSYSMDTHVLNQYNRKRVVQTKTKYDPIQITFHDDGGNLSRDLWKSYSQYYYGDLRNHNQKEQQGVALNVGELGINTDSLKVLKDADIYGRNIYSDTNNGTELWGYQAESIQGGPTKVPFFTNIIVYGFNQHDFVAYKLVNPIVTQFQHDIYTYNEGAGTMENSMTVDYETVIYETGKLDGRNPSKLVKDFALETHYDRRPSPLLTPGVNSSILGQGGLLDAAGGILTDLNSNPPNYLSALRTAGLAYNTFKNGNLKRAVQNEVNNVVRTAVTNNVNSARTYFTPTAASTPTIADSWRNTATNAINNLTVVPPRVSPTGTGVPPNSTTRPTT